MKLRFFDQTIVKSFFRDRIYFPIKCVQKLVRTFYNFFRNIFLQKLSKIADFWGENYHLVIFSLNLVIIFFGSNKISNFRVAALSLNLIQILVVYRFWIAMEADNIVIFFAHVKSINIVFIFST